MCNSFASEYTLLSILEYLNLSDFAVSFVWIDNMASIVSWHRDDKHDGIRLKHFKVSFGRFAH